MDKNRGICILFKVNLCMAAKLPSCEKELNKSLDLGMVAYGFNMSTQETEICRSLRSRSVYRAISRIAKLKQ